MEGRGVATRLLLPQLAIDLHSGDGFYGLLWPLVGEIVGFVLLFDSDLIVGGHGGELRGCSLVSFVSLKPQRRAEGYGIVVYRDGYHRDVGQPHEQTTRAPNLMGVVELVIADPDLNVCHPMMVCGAL